MFLLPSVRRPFGPLGGPALAAGSARTFVAWNACGIPTTARALSVNVTGTEASVFGHFRIHPADQLVPATSTLNLVPGSNRANNTIIALDAAGGFTVRCVLASGTAHLVVDVNGYFE